MSLSARCLLILVAFVPATLPAAIVSSEIAVSAATIEPAPGNQFAPLIATDGTDFLVVWADGRSAVASASIYSTRLTANGDVLDPLGTRLGAGVNAAEDLVWTGSSYLLISRSGQLVRISRDGKVSGATDIAATIERLGDVASNGVVTLVGYQTTDSPGVAVNRVAVLDSDGRVVRTFTLPSEGRLFDAPSFAWNGHSFIAVWTTWLPRETRVDAVRLSGDGFLLEPAEATTITSGYVENVASDGSGFAIVVRGPSRHGLVHISADLTVVSDVQPMAIPNGVESALAWDGSASAYVVTWAGFDGTLRAIAVDRHRSLLPFRVTDVFNGSSGVDIAANNEASFVVWADAPNGVEYGLDVSAANVTRGVAGPRQLLSRSSARQSFPAIASDGNGAVAVWQEPSGIYLSRIASDGRHLDGRGVKLSETNQAWGPDVVFDGSGYVVAWTEWTNGARLRTAVFRRDGSVVRGADIPGGVAGALAAGDDASLLVFHDSGGSLRAARLDANARLLAEPVIIVRNWDLHGSRLSYPAVGWSGSRWLVVWSEAADLVPQPFPGGAVYARAVVRAVLLDSSGLPAGGLWTLGDEPLTHLTSASIASNGDGFAIVWEKSRANEPSRIEGAIVSNDLVMTRRFIAGEGRLPSIAWSGNRYIAAWTSVDDVVGLAIAADGTTDDATFPIAASTAAEKNVALAESGGGVIAAYERVAEEPPYGGVDRVFARTVFSGASRRRAVVPR